MMLWTHAPHAKAEEPAKPWQAEPFAEQALERGGSSKGSEIA